MDKIDYDYELGMASDGSRVFPSMSCLKHYCRCVKDGGCGIVQVEVRLKRVMRHTDDKRMSKTAKPAKKKKRKGARAV